MVYRVMGGPCLSMIYQCKGDYVKIVDACCYIPEILLLKLKTTR